jgi:alpha-amylase/alpha-mannosidase (GH57 family)
MTAPSTRKTMVLAAAAALVAASCTGGPAAETTSTTSSPATTTAAPPATTVATPSEGIYLMLMWHHHQPIYPENADGVVTRPWVRVHATKDYYDMAALVAEYPDVHVTFNLTPSLMLQLEVLAAGTKDIYWVLSEVPAAELTADERDFILQRFFDTNARIIARFPRYAELAARRDQPQSFTVDDIRDLQVLFNLAWTDPSFLAEEPLASLVAKQQGYTEADKAIIFSEQERIIAGVLPLYRDLWDSGQIEVTTTPLAHPILPLVADSDQALAGDPTAQMPSHQFRQPDDAVAQVARGLDQAERLLGRRPVGMWPGEGAVSQLVMGMFAANDVQWVATGEDVLAKTLGIGSFARDGNDLVDDVADLYTMHAAVLSGDREVPMFFRDNVLSDRIGFEYSGTPAVAAVDDFMNRLSAINDALDAADVPGPRVVSVILDGENAWESYDNDGIDFLRELYRRLGTSDFVTTVTPSELLAMYPDAAQPLPDVFPAAWFQPNFATWIGEPEEATAWDYLYRVRQDYGEVSRQGEVADDAVAAAYEKMLFAEGSDWFWWFGADQDSGDDGYFDRAFRELLGQVYDELGEQRPAFVGVPIVPAPSVDPARTPAEPVTIEIDGDVTGPEWVGAGGYGFDGGGQISQLDYAYDLDNLYLRVGLTGAVGGSSGFDLYLGVPGPAPSWGLSNGGAVLGFNAAYRFSWRGGDPSVVVGPISHAERGDAGEMTIPAGSDGSNVEFAVPWEELGAIGAGDRLQLRIADVAAGAEGVLLPAGGPGYVQVPDISNVEIRLEVTDPAGDDHGPGSYVYPEDGVFAPGSYDLTGFTAGVSGGDAVFSFDVAAAIGNPWNSPAGYSVQTFDLYIDKDPGAGTGARLLLPGRNASLEAGNGWDYALTLEGWYPALYVAAADGSSEETSPTFRVIVDGAGTVTARIPIDLLGGGDPAEWGYAVTLMSQEGYPSAGVRRIRDVLPAAEQWKGGGAPDDANHSRIYDVLDPDEGVQEQLLGDYVPFQSVEGLTPDDFGRVPLVGAG